MARRSDLARWVAAGVVALGAHVGGAALALMEWPESLPDETAGAVLVELAPLPAVAPVDTPDLAHGPLTQEVAPVQEAAKQQVEPEEIALPAEPSPAPNPEVALPAERPRPEEEQPPEEAAQNQENEKQEATEATLAMAPPRIEAQPSPNTAPPSPGRAASLAREQAAWEKRLVNHLNKHKRYPPGARNRGAQGTVVVVFKIDRAGRVLASRIKKASGSSLLDEEALGVLERASPLPAPPDHLSGSALELVLPIQFRLK